MPGRPQRKAPPTRPRPGPAPAPARRPLRDAVLDAPPAVRAPGDRITPRDGDTPLEGRFVAPSTVRLSHAYAFAADLDLARESADDPDAVMAALNDASARRNGGRVKVADLIAACIVKRIVSPGSRDGVAAAKELADRIDGPVVQRVETASVRYVVSVTPGGGMGQAQEGPLTVAEWEGQVASSGALPALPQGHPERS